MALRGNVIEKVKHTSEVKEYFDKDGNVIATFEVRGSNYKPYQIAMNRIRAILAARKENITDIDVSEKSEDELVTEATAAHLIVNWTGVELSFDNGETYKPVEYSLENAIQLLNLPDIGFEIYQFIMSSANQIFLDEVKRKTELLGKSETLTGGKQPKATSKPQPQKGKRLQNTQAK